jgi:uncharacterized protein (DUF305 family)
MRIPAMTALLAGACALPVAAQETTATGQADPAPPPAAFQASSTRSFDALMDEAMDRMMDGMHRAPASGAPDRDFVTMMIPHHQGAVDMARALLAHSEDPELRNLAQSILVEQASEIALMRAWLARHEAATVDTAQHAAQEAP